MASRILSSLSGGIGVLICSKFESIYRMFWGLMPILIFDGQQFLSAASLRFSCCCCCATASAAMQPTPDKHHNSGLTTNIFPDVNSLFICWKPLFGNNSFCKIVARQSCWRGVIHFMVVLLLQDLILHINEFVQLVLWDFVGGKVHELLVDKNYNFCLLFQKFFIDSTRRVLQ